MKLPLPLLRWLRDRQARKAMSSEQIREADKQRRQLELARKVKVIQIARTSITRTPKFRRLL